MKNWERYIALHQLGKYVLPLGTDKIHLCVVIPCFNEPDIETTLKSLEHCSPPQQKVAVVVVVNGGEHVEDAIKQHNRNTYARLVGWMNEKRFATFTLLPLLIEDIPKKHAGVGYARKTGMDFAIWLMHRSGSYEGILLNLDADCTVAPNFLRAIEDAYGQNPKLGLTTQYFEHDLSLAQTRKSILQYELYLRYFRLALFYGGFPYPIHTVGSCISIKADVYVANGGMNRRQGGEDFYFLHKVVPNVAFAEVNNTTVYPSSRYSNRVPFGTGRTMRDLAGDKPDYQVYNPAVFTLLKNWTRQVPFLYGAGFKEITECLNEQHKALTGFFEQNGHAGRIAEINRNAASQNAFTKRYYKLFDAFQWVKLLNIAHETMFHRMPVAGAVACLLPLMGIEPQGTSVEVLLNQLRTLDKSGRFAFNPL